MFADISDNKYRFDKLEAVNWKFDKLTFMTKKATKMKTFCFD